MRACDLVGCASLRKCSWIAMSSGWNSSTQRAGLPSRPGAPRLLHVRLGRPGHLVVDDVADVGLVDAEAERVGRQHDDLAPRLHERRLRLLALVGRHLAVVALDRDLAVAERDVQIVDRAHRRAVDDARAGAAAGSTCRAGAACRPRRPPCARRTPGSGGGTRRGRPSGPSSRAAPARRRAIAGVAVAVSPRIGGRPSTCAARRSPRYDGRKSWPHCDTQCASSTQNSENFTPASASCTVGEFTDSGVIITSLMLPSRTAARSAARSFAVRVESMRTIGDAGRLQLGVLILDQRQQRRDHQRRARPSPARAADRSATCRCRSA